MVNMGLAGGAAGLVDGGAWAIADAETRRQVKSAGARNFLMGTSFN
jgi:hypothetical protein